MTHETTLPTRRSLSFAEWRQPANLLSTLRVLLGPVVLYLLSRHSTTASIAVIFLFILAGITDALDGWLARRSHHVTSLGMVLDPLADKLFALCLVAGLIWYREFPLWLAGIIVGRDLLILLGGAVLLRRRRVIVPSNVTGKYAFAAVVLLLGSYVIAFPFGIRLMTAVSLFLIAASVIGYTIIFIRVLGGEAPSRRRPERPWMRTGRAVLTAAVGLVYAVALVRHWLAG